MDASEKERRRDRLVGLGFVVVVFGVTWAFLPIPMVAGIPWILGAGAVLFFLSMLGRRRSVSRHPPGATPPPGTGGRKPGGPASRAEDADGPCPPCRRDDRELLVRIDRHGVPHGAEGHDHTFRTAELFRCSRCGRGQLVREDHDCFSRYDMDDRWEPWDLEWTYGLDAADTESLRRALSGLCPDPRDPLCSCAAHEGLRSSRLAATGGALVPVVLRMSEGVPTLESRPAD